MRYLTYLGRSGVFTDPTAVLAAEGLGAVAMRTTSDRYGNVWVTVDLGEDATAQQQTDIAAAIVAAGGASVAWAADQAGIPTLRRAL